MNELNTSVLIIDDEEMVRDNIEDILIPRGTSQEQDCIDNAMNVLFDTPQVLFAPRVRNIPVFTVDKAANGMEGVRKVREAVALGCPYAVIFLDMRMPGLDGLATAMEIRKYDCKAEIVFLTAFSDHSIEDIVDQAGQNVGYHCKPYAPEEIIQLATKAVTDYDKLRNLENLIESISSIGLNNNQLNHLLKNILVQVAGSLQTDMALIGKLHDDFAYEKVLSIGDFEENIDLDELIARAKNSKIEKDQLVQIGDFVLARMENYSIFAILKRQESLKVEKMYLLKLFMQNATQAIRNAELNEQLIQKEKLSAVGQVIGMVIHDLRSPINNIKQVLSLMRDEGESSDLLGLIDQSAERASDIFDDFLDFIKNNPIKKVPVSINKIAGVAIKQAATRKGYELISISQDISGDLFVPGDESKLKRVLINLVNNAIEVLSEPPLKDAAIHISARRGEKELILDVADNGPGIPPEISNTLFEPFITKHKKNGTGLGLAIVKQFITMHGGSIEVNNNNGAIFTINLPLE
ncbi:MAG TPA: hybrid sensor histidine kinase/response regulator [Mucilaginibacter sp.]|nr:hybrid sensor histidine kinase/response regulator [Mucilaginibacter sp.]